LIRFFVIYSIICSFLTWRKQTTKNNKEVKINRTRADAMKIGKDCDRL